MLPTMGSESEQLIAELAAKRQTVELQDERGRTLGSFVPAELSPFPDRSEIDRRCAAGGGILIAEFWKNLGVE
jgi:hypothetical protein